MVQQSTSKAIVLWILLDELRVNFALIRKNRHPHSAMKSKYGDPFIKGAFIEDGRNSILFSLFTKYQYIPFEVYSLDEFANWTVVSRTKTRIK